MDFFSLHSIYMLSNYSHPINYIMYQQKAHFHHSSIPILSHNLQLSHFYNSILTKKISVISLFYPFQLWYSYSLFTNPSHNNKNRKTTSSLFIHIPTIIQLFSVDHFPFTSAFFSHDYLPLLTDLFILSSQPFSFSLWSSPFLSSPFSYLLISHINPN